MNSPAYGRCFLRRHARLPKPHSGSHEAAIRSRSHGMPIEFPRVQMFVVRSRTSCRSSGISDEQLETRIAEGLNATIVLRATRYGKREVVVNFTERREMVQLVLRLKGYLIERHDVRVRRWRKSSRIPTEEKDPTNETRRKCSEVLSHRTADNLESAPTLCASAFPPTVYVSHRRGKIPSRTSVNMNA